MKFPSLTKIPRYQRFNIEPRYYDPVKEDIERRTSLIESELKANASNDYKTSIAGSFSQQRNKESANASLLQVFIVIFLLGTVFGFIFYGNNVFYGYILLIPVYFYYKRRKAKGTKTIQ